MRGLVATTRDGRSAFRLTKGSCPQCLRDDGIGSMEYSRSALRKAYRNDLGEEAIALFQEDRRSPDALRDDIIWSRHLYNC